MFVQQHNKLQWDLESINSVIILQKLLEGVQRLSQDGI
jgi:hypothetical protein